jgi:hypothetical protein
MSSSPRLRTVIGPCVLGLTLIAGCNNADQGGTPADSSTTGGATATPTPTTPTPGGRPIDKGGPPSGAAGTAK